MSLWKFLFKHRTWRIGKASKFGKIEHKAGRLLGVTLFISISFAIYLKNTGYGFPGLFYLSFINFLIWLTYLTAHTIEKKLYGHFGPRG